jgi:hypothetical protein
MKRQWIVASLVLFGLLASGCSDNMSPADYSHVWRDAVVQYRKIDKNPDDPAATPDGNGDGSVQAHMQAASNISAKIRDIATSLKDLKAPEQYQELQEETYLFYRGQADDYSAYSEALGAGDPDKIATAVDRLNNFAGENQQKISQIIKGIGGDPTRFKNSWDSVLKDMPAPKS